jgi:hypothetical protein
MNISRIGVDLAKNVFQVHGTDNQGHVTWKRKLSREKWIAVPSKNHIRESLPPLFHQQKARYRRPIFLNKGSSTLDPASSGNSNNCWRTRIEHRLSR